MTKPIDVVRTNSDTFAERILDAAPISASMRCRYRFFLHPTAALLILATIFAVACADKVEPTFYEPLPVREDLRINNPSDRPGGGNIVGAAMDDAGSLYVMEQARQQLLVFDSAGRMIRTIGGPGDEPGGFIMLGSMGLIGDTVWVSDPVAGRLTLFRRDGTVAGMLDNSEDLPIPGDTAYSLLGLLPDGSRLIAMAPEPPGIGVQPARNVPFLRVTKAGEVDSMFTVPIPATYGFVAGTRTRQVMQPFDESPVVGVRRDGGAWIVVERSAGEEGPAVATITKHSLERGVEWKKTVQLDAVRLPRELVDSIVNAESVDPEQSRKLREWMHVPKRLPLVGSAMLSDDGSIWLQETSRGTTRRWLLLDAEGDPRGQITLPATATVLFASANLLWVMEEGPGGTPSLVRLRVGE